MRKIRIRVLVVAFLFLCTLFGGLGYFYTLYTSTVVTKNIQDVHLHKTVTYAEELASLIIGEFNATKDKVDQYLSTHVVTNILDTIHDLENESFIKERNYRIFSLTKSNLGSYYLNAKEPRRLINNSLVISQRQALINNIDLSENAFEIYFSFSVLDDYLVLVTDFPPFVNRVINNDKGYFYLISTDLVTNAGEIVYEKKDPKEITNSLFYSLLDSMTNDNIEPVKSEIQAEQNGFRNLKLEGVKKTLFYSPLLQDQDKENYVLVLIETEDNLLSAVSSIRTFTLVFMITTFVLSILSIIYVFVVVNKRTYEITASRFSYQLARTFIIEINHQGKIKYINQALRVKVIGMKKCRHISELTSQNPYIFTLINEEQPFILSFKTPNDQDLHINFVSFKIRGGYELVGIDVTSTHNELHNLRDLALFNSLTKLPNKDNLIRQIKTLVNNYPAGKHGVLIFNVVQFRNINHIFGRTIGDQVLLKVRDIVSNILVDNEKLFHIDADNFAILKFNVEDSDLFDTAKRLIKLFDNPINIASNMLSIRIKAGIYNFETQEIDRSDFASYAISNAQLALRKAQESRQLFFATFDISIGQVLNREMVMANDLKEALKRHEMVMYFQPQYDLKKKKIFGFEALMKWANPKYINESAEKFIRMAEHNGLIIPLGKFAVDEAFRVAKKYEKENIKISVNISPVQILQSGFIRDLEATAQKFEVDPRQICLEITETFMIESFNEIIDKLKLLRELGFSVHLDDFGTGFSSLLYLKELPITTLKIDKEFIKPIAYDEYSRSIVKHVVDLTRNLDLDVIAEGVETEEQKQIILKSGCSLVQGYLISKAIPEKQMEDLLDLHNRKKV